MNSGWLIEAPARATSTAWQRQNTHNAHHTHALTTFLGMPRLPSTSIRYKGATVVLKKKEVPGVVDAWGRKYHLGSRIWWWIQHNNLRKQGGNHRQWLLKQLGSSVISRCEPTTRRKQAML